MEKYTQFLDSQLRGDYYFLLKRADELKNKLKD